VRLGVALFERIEPYAKLPWKARKSDRHQGVCINKQYLKGYFTFNNIYRSGFDVLRLQVPDIYVLGDNDGEK
jgi:hypothetical protein